MYHNITGLSDIHMILSNERQWFGAIEAELIRLQSGEEYRNAVILQLDCLGTNYYTLGLFSEKGENVIIHVNEISQIKQPKHKPVKELVNTKYRSIATEQRLQYLQRLCTVNCGSCSPFYCEELLKIVNDIGLEASSVKDEVVRNEVRQWAS